MNCFKNQILSLKKHRKCVNKTLLNIILIQMRRGAKLLSFKLVIALPDDPSVFWSWVPYLWAKKASAVRTYKFSGKKWITAVLLAKLLASCHFKLDLLKFFRADYGIMRFFNPILRNLALVDFHFLVRKSVVNFFCSSAEPLYFSFVRILFIVDWCHFSFPWELGFFALSELLQ